MMAEHRQKGTPCLHELGRCCSRTDRTPRARSRARLLVTLFRDEAGLEVDLSTDPADLTGAHSGSRHLPGLQRHGPEYRHESAGARRRPTSCDPGQDRTGYAVYRHARSHGAVRWSVADGARQRPASTPATSPGGAHSGSSVPRASAPARLPGASPADDAELTQAQAQYLAMIGSAFISHPPLSVHLGPHPRPRASDHARRLRLRDRVTSTMS